MHIFVSLSGCFIYHLGIESLFFFHVFVLPLGLEASVLSFIAIPQVCLQFVIVVFPDHTHLYFMSLMAFFYFVCEQRLLLCQLLNL